MEALIGLVGLGLAAPGLIDVLVRAGLAVETRVSDARKIDEHLRTYQTFGIELSRGLLRTQVELVSSAIQNATVPEELSAQLEGCFKRMIECLIEADKKFKAVEASRIKGRFRLLFGSQVGLKSNMQELEQQQELFMTLASFIHLQQSAPPPMLLTNRIKLRHESKHNQAGHILRTSDIRVAVCDMGGGTVKTVIVERRPYTTLSKSGLEEDVKTLTRKLRLADFSQSIAKCLGYRQNPFEDAYDIFFELPEDPNRRSLADMLTYDQPPTLSHRVALCKQLARTVSDIHNIKLVQKNIRPRNILVVGQYHDIRSTQTLFLTDWTLVREVGQPSFWIGEDDWQHAIYQHPTRQGLQAESEYTIKHDIYSLGVCMLEVLLWQPLIVRSDSRVENSPNAISKIFQKRAIELGEEQGVPERYFGDNRKMTSRPAVVRRVIVDLCRTELPACAGNKLTKVVMDCLCCLDAEDDPAMGASNENELESGLDYVRDVLIVLDSVSI